MNILGRLVRMFRKHDVEKHEMINELTVVKGRSELANKRADEIAKEARRRTLQLQLEVAATRQNPPRQ